MTPVLEVRFYRTTVGNEPVRDWLKELSKEDKKSIGDDVKTVQLGWPLGMPLVRKLENGLWEVRVDLHGGRIARVLFTVEGSEMVLVHGFIKKSKKTPKTDLDTARTRMKEVRNG